MKNLTKKLDILNESLDYNNLLNFRFSKDRNHDRNLLFYFCNSGEMRVYQYFHKTFKITLVNKNLRLDLGSIFLLCNKERRWQNDYISFAWDKLNLFKYTTNNLLRTPEEVIKSFRGNPESAFINSSETYASIKRNSKLVKKILNSLGKVNLE